MYCNHCGQQNPDGATFCNHCRAPVSAGTAPVRQMNSIDARKNTRNAELTELERMMRHFSQKNAQYEEYDRLSAELDLYAKGKHHALLVWGIIVSVLGMLLCSVLYFGTVGEAQYMALFLFLAGQAMVVGYIVYSVRYTKRKETITSRYDAVSYELFEHYCAYGICAVGCEYTNPTNLAAVSRTIRSGRADTIKEALNVLVEDAYRTKMQAFAAQAARSAAAAARGARTSAIFSAANFFFK